jgi:hypothetical protein
VILPVQSCREKYSVSHPAQIKSIFPTILFHMRGVSRSSRTRDGMRWTRAVLLTRAPACGRRSRVVLTPRRWRQVSGGNATGDGDKKARSPGRARRKPLKPLRAGMPGVPVDLWRLPRVLSTFAHEAAGAAGTRHSPRPLFSGQKILQRPGRIAPRGCGGVCGIPPHRRACERRDL